MGKLIRVRLYRLIAALLVGNTVSYVMWAAIGWDWDMGNWSIKMRMLCVFIGVIASLITGSILFSSPDDKRSNGREYYNDYDEGY